MKSRKTRDILLAAGLAVLPLASFYISRSATLSLRRAPERASAETKESPSGSAGPEVAASPGVANAAEPVTAQIRPSPMIPFGSGRERPEAAKKRLLKGTVRADEETLEEGAARPVQRTPVNPAPERQRDAATEPARSEGEQTARADGPGNCPPCPEVQPCPPAGRAQAARTVRPAASFILMSASPSAFRSAVNKVPLLRRLQRGRYKAGEEFVPARPISVDPPEVPATLQDRSTAEVVAEVGESGEVRKARRRRGDETLGAIGAQAVRNWRFEPATLEGEPVKSNVIVQFTFNSATVRRAAND